MELFILLGAMALSFFAGWSERGQELKPGECVRLEQGDTFTQIQDGNRIELMAVKGTIVVMEP